MGIDAEVKKEVEVKILNVDRATIESKLDNIGASCLWTARVTDWIYQNYSKKYRGQIMRIRQYTYNSVQLPSELAWKGPDENDTVFKIKPEIQTRIEDPNNADSILGRIGWKKSGHREKVRTKYNYEGVDICIDENSGLSPLIEIEGTKEQIRRVVGLLGYKMSDTVGKDWKKQLPKGFNVDECRFKD